MPQACKHMPTCIHSIYQHAIWSTTCDMEYNMRYGVQHALVQVQYACAKCMRTTATWHNQRSKFIDKPTRGFPSIMLLEKAKPTWKQM